MQIFETLSHMPYKAGDDLFFCQSSGAVTFETPQTAMAIQLGHPQQITSFQPWSLAVLRDGVVHSISVQGSEVHSPNRIFCTPVVDNGFITFIYARCLWIAELTENFVLTPTLVRRNVFSGFVKNGVTFYTDLHCVGSKSSFVVGEDRHETEFDTIVRIVPHGSSIIITGQKDGTEYSILWSSDHLQQRIKVNGEDVYKCCIDGTQIYYAKKVGEGFEERYIFQDSYTLV